METAASTVTANQGHLSIYQQIFITIAYVTGIVGNGLALWILNRSETLRNKRQTLMLKCLAYNDFIALTGSITMMFIQMYTPLEIKDSQPFCGTRVFFRIFGFGSGCVAIVMAIERFIALNSPFAYQKHVTYNKIKWSIIILWIIAVIIICLPFLGFGLYYDNSPSPSAQNITKGNNESFLSTVSTLDSNENYSSTIPSKPLLDFSSRNESKQKKMLRCKRYRDGVTPMDIAYAYLMLAFGLIMCLCIVICNLGVVRVLYQLSLQHRANAFGKFRHKLSPSTSTNGKNENRDSNRSSNTHDEISFAKLMVLLCMFFVICWLPQMYNIIIAQMGVKPKFSFLADACIAMNFILDPFIYVLFRHLQQRRIRDLCHPVCLQECNLSRSNSSGLETEIKNMNSGNQNSNR